MSIAFVDKIPTIEAKHGHAIVTFDSGGDTIQIMLTPHALFGLGRHAVNTTCETFREAEVIQLRSAT